MPQYRDVVLKEKAKQDRKQDLLKFQRAVLTDAQGNQTGSGSVWASQSERRVWCMTLGAIQPGQVLCVRVSDPVIGLGVIIGYADGSNEKEVLSDDFFLRKTGDPTGWYSTSPGDLEPGGLKMMWIYSKVVTPLATYPDPTGLSVNVIAGDYPYAGARVSFGGQSGYLLVEPATPGEHYYAGLYLDSANTLQVVYGTAVVVATAPPEPTWPAGAFRLSVVKIANGQTSINFNDDVFDRRMAWSDEQAGSVGGWPFAHVLTVSTTDPDADYSTIATAITAAATGDVVLLDAGSYGPDTFTLNKDITLRGPAVGRAILTNNTGSATLTVSTAGARVENITVINTDEGSAVNVTAATATLERVITQSIAATGSIKYGIAVQSATKCTLIHCEATVSGASLSNDALLVTSSGICDVFGGRYSGSTQDVSCASGNTLTLTNPVLINATIFGGGTIRGSYQNASGDLVLVGASILAGVDKYIITPSVASNDLTVALKTLAGTDPTEGSPIFVKIGDVVRPITAALSVTANDGTNWFNSGSAELATKDIDYFVYLIEETGGSAGTKIGFARVPYANQMGDFVNTTTSEKYIKGNWTNFNATDPVALIGRFNAILSATAAFTWSLTTAVVINRPVYETRWLDYTPTLSSSGGTITTVGARSGLYLVGYNKLFFNQTGTITTNGTGAAAIRLTLPFTPTTDSSICAGRENAVTGAMLQARAASNYMEYLTYANGYPGASGAQIVGGGIALRLV